MNKLYKNGGESIYGLRGERLKWHTSGNEVYTPLG